MAKQQGLSLNPTKISGQCGRLMCCLTFENETYKRLKAKFPKIGKTIKTKKLKGKVTRHNVIRNTISIRVEGGQEIEVNPAEIIRKRR